MGNQSFALSGYKISELKQSAIGGDAEAAMRLANYYGYFRNDQSKEIYWLRIGADSGSVACQTNLATLLLALRKPESTDEAIHYLHTAADAGDADAQFVLAEIYEQGEGAAIDLGAARTLYQKSAGQGHFRAMVRFGEFALEGIGGPVDKVLGFTWLLKARRTVRVNTVLFDDLSEKIEQARKTMSDTQIEEATCAAG